MKTKKPTPRMMTYTLRGSRKKSSVVMLHWLRVPVPHRQPGREEGGGGGGTASQKSNSSTLTQHLHFLKIVIHCQVLFTNIICCSLNEHDTPRTLLRQRWPISCHRTHPTNIITLALRAIFLS